MTNLTNLDDLFQSAQDDGLTDDALDLVIANLNGPAVAAAVHTPLDQLTSNDVTLAMNIIDMSGSMYSYANDLIRAYNQDYLAAMRHSPAADDILVSTILFHDDVQTLHGYVPLADAPPLDNKTYNPDNATALYDAVAAGMTNMVLYAQQLRQSGVSARGVVMVYTDGEDNASRQRAQDVRRAAQDLLRQEIYTLALVGFGLQKPLGFPGSSGRTPAQQLAHEIGFSIGLDAGLNALDLQRIFRLASMTAVQVSQTGAAAVFTFTA
ncbi:MAG TPA: hypothetical protein EYP41_06700 [Anaerolineae bacterium]|nr:hypothetical protein [Anaerolineae bacterium]HIP73340.1 hypothetical protein [Anaerolineae bacterium]